MLVLQRKKGEVVRIGNQGEIAIKILSQENGVTRLGIEAPKDILIDREEIRCKRQSLSSSQGDLPC
jgi:carbon storage regulator CsrA